MTYDARAAAEELVSLERDWPEGEDGIKIDSTLICHSPDKGLIELIHGMVARDVASALRDAYERGRADGVEAAAAAGEGEAMSDDEKQPPHPMQPLVRDPHGVVRFRKNRAVDALLEHGNRTGFDLCHVVMRAHEERWPADDLAQLAQLIGYSVGGYNELSYVSDESAWAANAARDALLEREGGGG